MKALAPPQHEPRATDHWKLGAITTHWCVGAEKSSSGRVLRRQKARLLARGLWCGAVGPTPQVAVALHVHVAPVTLPLLARGTRLVVMLHGIEAWQMLTGPRRTAIARASLLLANSAFTAKMFCAANYAWASNRPIAVCHLGIPDAVGPTAAWCDGGYALIVGRMSAGERYKGHDELLDAWPHVLARHPGAKLIVVGDGNDRPRLEAKAAEFGLRGAVQFLGRVSDVALCGLYRGARYFVMPSRGDGFGLVYLEAMRAAKACIAGNDGGAEVVRDGKTGLIVDPQDRSALVSALCTLEGDLGLRRAFGLAGRARFLAHFTEEKFAKRLRAALGAVSRKD